MADDVFRMDTSTYKPTRSDRLTPGQYRVKVEDAKVSPSTGAKTQGAPMMMVWLRVMGGEFDGSTIVDRLIAHDTTMFRVVDFLKACGVRVPRGVFSIRTSSVIGKVLDVEVDDNEYGGSTTSQVRAYSAVAGGARQASSNEPSDITDVEEVSDHSPAAAQQRAQVERGTSDEVVDIDEVDLDQVDL